MKRRKRVREHPGKHKYVEHDLAYWLEHVAHWGVLLAVAILGVAVFAEIF